MSLQVQPPFVGQSTFCVWLELQTAEKLNGTSGPQFRLGWVQTTVTSTEQLFPCGWQLPSHAAAVGLFT